MRYNIAEIKMVNDDQIPHSLLATPKNNGKTPPQQIFQGFNNLNPTSSSDFGSVSNTLNNSRHPTNQLRHTADPFYKG